MEPTTKKWGKTKNVKTWICSEVSVQSEESAESVLKKKKELVGRICRKGLFLSLG